MKKAPLSCGHLPIGTSPKGERRGGGWKTEVRSRKSEVISGMPRWLGEVQSQKTEETGDRASISDHWLATATPDGAASPVRGDALPGRSKSIVSSRKLAVGGKKQKARNPRLAAHNLKLAACELQLKKHSSQLLNKNQNITTISLTPLLWIYSYGRGRERLLLKYNQCCIFPPPSPFGEGRGEASFSLLPRGSAGSGDCPGAAAITTIISFLFSSLRGASKNAGAKRLARKNSLPVINQSLESCAVGLSPFVKGDESRFTGTGGKGSQSPATPPIRSRKKDTNQKGGT
ncbi:hypothetical protein SAMN05444280_11383 [Tangfeifania diversioriginum]|uniref:Uncharacterized protein n=1 Tax=Tangfeifania diversioriginum TaxID=1168035 RepID=A0A1M6HGN3_9BACT|nr:hypothetical protein SAMN05444280_11383 [Tangfeifania diversioriginum]